MRHLPTSWAKVLPVTVVVTFVGCHSLQLDGAGVVSRQFWPTEGGDSQRTHFAPAGLTTPLQLDWEYNAAAGFGPGGALVSGNYVIVANRKGEIHAVDATRGKKVGVKGFGDSIDGTPALSENMLYVPVSSGRKTGLVAYDIRRGTRAWMFRSAPVTTGVLVASDRIVFVDEEPRVYALSKSGQPVWDLLLDETSAIRGTPVLVNGNTVAVADDAGRVYGIDTLTGEVIWQSDLEEPVYAAMVSRAGHLFVPTTRGGLFALDGLSGSQHWRYHDDNRTVKLATPAVADDVVLSGGSDGRLRALSVETGEIRWTWQAGGAITSAPVVAGRRVYVGTMNATAHGLDLETGTEVWTTEVRGRIKSAPAVAADAIYFLGEPRFLYRFSPKEEVDENG